MTVLDAKSIELLAEQIVRQLKSGDLPKLPEKPVAQEPHPMAGEQLTDITSREQKSIPLLTEPQDYDALVRMKGKTNARIGVGRCGPRLNTRTLLTLRADHAMARDAVFSDVSAAFLEQSGLVAVQSRCNDKNEHITRPDLGRQLSDAARETIRTHCKSGVDVQLIVADGLSSKAVEANSHNALPVITEGLRSRGLTVGDPFFVKYGRVAIEDEVAELLGAKVVCILIGERPGLATAESMSAYICYNARVGQPEARRTVVSNIHSGGIAAVEAGAYVAELIQKIITAGASGVELKQ